jgi:predicted RNA-binding Zn ribbon-like protein
VRFEFIAGRLALDFVATVSERGTSDVERLPGPADLADWVALAEIVDGRLTVDQAGLTAAKQLRETLFALVTVVTEDRAVPVRDLELINTVAAASPPTLTLANNGRVRRDGDLRSVLALLARDGIDLVDSPDRRLVRWCADDTCTRPFVDRSRGQRRRWCGMTGCGDRAKAAAYRQRRRQS